MSVLKTLKLSLTAPTATSVSSKERSRQKVLNHLEQQKAYLAPQMDGKPFDVVRNVYQTNSAGERVRIARPTFVKKDWFEDSAGTVMFMVRYGNRALRLDKIGNISVEVGKLDALPGVIDALIGAVKAGELDAQLATASLERSKAFTRRTSKAS
jgi:hypothetical protein